MVCPCTPGDPYVSFLGLLFCYFQTGQLKQPMFILLQFWGPQILGQGADRTGSSCRSKENGSVPFSASGVPHA